MFGVLLFVLDAKEKAFQTSWLIESVISAILIVRVVRTRMPFFKSRPGKWLSIATIIILIFVLALPFTPLATWFGFAWLPLAYYGWMLMIVLFYLGSAELAKH